VVVNRLHRGILEQQTQPALRHMCKHYTNDRRNGLICLYPLRLCAFTLKP
jgi:hypothetical protein